MSSKSLCLDLTALSDGSHRLLVLTGTGIQALVESPDGDADTPSTS